MGYNEIRALLEKYWNGDTDISEEETLKLFFLKQHDLPEDLKAAKKLFQSYDTQSKNPQLTEDLTVKLRNIWTKEKIKKNVSIWKTVIKYAAILIPFLIFGYFIIQKNHKEKLSSVQTDTFEEPEKAIAETERVLMLLSKNMNDGLVKVQSLQAFDEAQKNVKETKK